MELLQIAVRYTPTYFYSVEFVSLGEFGRKTLRRSKATFSLRQSGWMFDNI